MQNTFIRSLRTEIKSKVVFSIFLSLMIILAFTPLGMITIGPTSILLAHIPLLLAYVFLPNLYGDILGLLFGIFRLIRNTYLILPLSSFWFSPFAPVIGSDKGSYYSLIINFLPMLLIALGARIWGAIFSKNNSEEKKKKVFLFFAWGAIGSIINTVTVLLTVYYFFFQELNAALEGSIPLYQIFFGIAFTNGLLEAFMAGVILATCGKFSNKHVRQNEVK